MMKPNELLEEAKTLQPQLQKWRRAIHRNPEVGFDLPKTPPWHREHRCRAQSPLR